jgi:hypothetical protein
MVRNKKETALTTTKFFREPEISIDGFTISHGDMFKVKGEYGNKFKVVGFVTNLETGAQWVDCFEVVRGQVGAFRSFRSDRIKRIPQKGKRAKRVNT